MAGDLLIVLDTNCFIDGVTPTAHEYAAASKLLAKGSSVARLAVSRHSLHELSSRDDQALGASRAVDLLPYYPVGAISDLLGTIDGLAGSLDDMRRSDEMLQKLNSLARSGADLRDKGALIDALWAEAAMFVTSDQQLVGTAPAQRISAAFSIQIVTPSAAIRHLEL